MNGVRGLGIAEIGDREVPTSLNLRQEEMGEEDRFTSVLSRLTGSAKGGAALLHADEDIASRPASGVPDSRLPRFEADEEIQDEAVADGAFDLLHGVERQVGMLSNGFEAKQELLQDVSDPGILTVVPEAVADGPNLLHIVERQVGVPPSQSEANQELLRDASERSDLAVAPPVNNELATSAAVGLDLAAAVAAIAEIGSPDLLPDALRVGGNEPTEPTATGDAPLLTAIGGLRPAAFDEAPPAAVTGEPPARHTELIALQGDRTPGEAEIGRRSPPPHLPHMTVISRETHFAPAQRPGLVRPAILPSNPQPDPPASTAKGRAAGPDTPPHGDRHAYTGDLPTASTGPESGPQDLESGTPRNFPASIVPAVAEATTSSMEGRDAPPDDVAGAGQGPSQRIAPPPEPSRATVIAQEKPFAPARRLDPAAPATSDRQPEPPPSPVARPASVSPEAMARSAHPATEGRPPLPIMRGSTSELPERHERGHQPVGVSSAAASATKSSTESALFQTGGAGAPGLGQEALQRISGAVIEAAGDAALPATAAAVATAGVGDYAVASTPTRALTIRIDLNEHGALHVRLALNGNALSLRMRADHEETAEQLRQDHQKLSDALSAAGYETEIVAIEARRSEIAPLPGNDRASPVGTGTNDAANADRGPGGEDRRPASRQAQAPDQRLGENFFPRDQEDHEARHIAQRRAGALYV